MQFSSKTPRDLSHDPQPWSVGDTHGRELRSDIEPPETAVVDWAEYVPRPEFDHVQHNKPNVILVAIRVLLEDADEASAAFYADAGKYLTGGTHALGIPIQEGMSDHARRVLNRLARLTEGESA